MSVERIEALIDSEKDISTKIDPLAIPDGDPNLQLKCNLYIHSLIKEWESTDPPYLPERLPELKSNILPLLVQLRKSILSKELFTTLASILYHLQQDEYDRAEQRYMDLSIGNAAWPIGVGAVGIHSANGASHSLGVSRANVMKDAVTKGWILQIKRIITFCSTVNETSEGDEDEDEDEAEGEAEDTRKEDGSS